MRVYNCTGCGKAFIPREPSVRCVDGHPYGSCCHFGEIEVTDARRANDLIIRLAMAVNLLRFAVADVGFDTPEDTECQVSVLAKAQELIGDDEEVLELASGSAYRSPDAHA